MITSDVASVVYDCDGVTVSFPITIEHTAKEDILVTVVDEDGNSTALIEGTNWDYTEDGDDISAELGTAYAEGYQIVISLDIEGTQEVEFLQGDPLPPNVLNGALDKLTLLINQVKDQISRNLYAPAGDSGKDFVLPSAAARAGRLLRFSDDENALPEISDLITQPVSDYLVDFLKLTTQDAVAQFFAGPQYLTSGRKFAEELRTDLGESITGWVTVAETDAGVVVPACSGKCSIMTNNGYGITIEYSLRPYASGMSSKNNTLKIISMCDTTAGFGTNIAGARIAYSASDTSGIKLQVYVITEQILNVQISNNLGRENGYKGLKVTTATITDIDKTPSGDGASFLEAGAGRTYLTATNRTPVPGWSGARLTDDVIGLTYDSPVLLKQNATFLSFGKSAATIFGIYLGDGSDVVNLLTESYTVSSVQVSGYQARIQITSTGAFAGWGTKLATLAYSGSLTHTFS